MTDAPNDHDATPTPDVGPSQAEGEDPDRPDTVNVLGADGKPSSAEGEDPDDTAEVHEVL
jgi:hypothetical protein